MKELREHGRGRAGVAVLALTMVALALPAATVAQVTDGEAATRPAGSGSILDRLLPVSVASPETVGGKPTAMRRKRLIEFGWDTPSAAYLHDHLSEMQTLPFDGVTFRLNTDGTPRLNAFDPGTWTEGQLAFPLLADLPSRYGRLDHSFIQLNGPSQSARMDWFDDSLWNQINAKMQLFSKAVAVSGAKGVLFDPEFYGSPADNDPWDFHSEQYPGRGFWQVAQQARERGREFISALQSRAPSLRFLSLFFPSYQYQHSPVSMLSAPERAPDPLMFFFDLGIIEGAGPNVQLIDGHEWSYYNGSTSAFIADHLAMRRTSDWLPAESHERWDGVQIGPGIFMDYAMGLYPAGAPETSLSDAEHLQWLEHNVYWALQSSDQYAWFYSERQDWYRNPGKPAGVLQAVSRARELVAGKEPLGYDISVEGDNSSRHADIWPGSLPLKLLGPSGRRTARPGEAITIRTSAPALTTASLVVDGVPVAKDKRRPFSFSLRETSPGPHTAIVHGELEGGASISSGPRTYFVRASPG